MANYRYLTPTLQAGLVVVPTARRGGPQEMRVLKHAITVASRCVRICIAGTGLPHGDWPTRDADYSYQYARSAGRAGLRLLELTKEVDRVAETTVTAQPGTEATREE